MTMDLDRRSFLQLLGMIGTAVVLPVGLIPAAAEPTAEPLEPLTVTDTVLSIWKDGAWVPVCGVSSFSVMRDEPDYYISGGLRHHVGIEIPKYDTVQITGRILQSRYDILTEAFNNGRGKFHLGCDRFQGEFEGYPAELRHTVSYDTPYVETDLAIRLIRDDAGPSLNFLRVYQP